MKMNIGNCEVLLDYPIANLEKLIGEKRAVIITDSNVRKYHENKFPKAPVVEIGQGEEIKTLETLEQIYEKMLELELDRASVVIGIGGGIVCDIAGFVASTYCRGMKLILVPTTLLAQVDAGIGGKNGVNFKGYKNIIGTFRQPEVVLVDTNLLETLNMEEMKSGYAEIVKHAAIADEKAFENLENCDDLFSISNLKDIVPKCAAIKVNVVIADEHEHGERMKLNFGHTIGHAVEKILKIPHGQAVAIGMVAEGKIAVQRGLLDEKGLSRLENLLEKIGLVTKAKMNAKKVVDAIRHDKKRRDDSLKMPLLCGIGNAKIVEVSLEEMERVIDDLY